ncbi:hypothetical protein L336_0035 [Candidatus Saccharimonas aalborgensis]|uniref:Uncharacterized protein n=1 Tax=Candidatus Saccharimonas aalborgensis TaxID=1332188 RepID=R4PX52_9BACT|nr:hypothetical protein L336_0035 [Candidatus Saccharimonas aalborgensis]
MVPYDGDGPNGEEVVESAVGDVGRAVDLSTVGDGVLEVGLLVVDDGDDRLGVEVAEDAQGVRGGQQDVGDGRALRHGDVDAAGLSGQLHRSGGGGVGHGQCLP